MAETMYSDFDPGVDDCYSAAESFREQAAAARADGDFDGADELEKRAVAHYREATGVAEHLNGEDMSEAENEAAEAVLDGAEVAASRDNAVTVATGAGDETVTVGGEVDFVGNPEHVKQALEAMAPWDDASGVPWVEELKAHWGSDLPANLGYARAFSEAHPDISQILETVGLADHPGLVLVAAMLGRRYATRRHDPAEITTQKGSQTMTTPSIDPDTFDEQTTDLMNEATQARATGNLAKSRRLQKQIDAMFVAQYGTDPEVGSSGVATA